MENIDHFSAEKSIQLIKKMLNTTNDIHSEKIDKKTKTKLVSIITKVQSVLDYDGIYAMVLFLNSKNGKEEFRIGKNKDLANTISNELMEYIKNFYEYLQHDIFSKTLAIERAQELIKNKEDVVLSKEIISKILTYARYYVKSMEES